MSPKKTLRLMEVLNIKKLNEPFIGTVALSLLTLLIPLSATVASDMASYAMKTFSPEKFDIAPLQTAVLGVLTIFIPVGVAVLSDHLSKENQNDIISHLQLSIMLRRIRAKRMTILVVSFFTLSLFSSFSWILTGLLFLFSLWFIPWLLLVPLKEIYRWIKSYDPDSMKTLLGEIKEITIEESSVGILDFFNKIQSKKNPSTRTEIEIINTFIQKIESAHKQNQFPFANQAFIIFRKNLENRLDINLGEDLFPKLIYWLMEYEEASITKTLEQGQVPALQNLRWLFRDLTKYLIKSGNHYWLRKAIKEFIDKNEQTANDAENLKSSAFGRVYKILINIYFDHSRHDIEGLLADNVKITKDSFSDPLPSYTLQLCLDWIIRRIYDFKSGNSSNVINIDDVIERIFPDVEILYFSTAISYLYGFQEGKSIEEFIKSKWPLGYRGRMITLSTAGESGANLDDKLNKILEEQKEYTIEFIKLLFKEWPGFKSSHLSESLTEISRIDKSALNKTEEAKLIRLKGLLTKLHNG